MKNPLEYVRPSIRNLKPYSTARDEYTGGEISVWLDANESPYDNGVNRYPDPHQRELKQEIGRLKGIDPDCIFIGGAGSDEAIDLTYRIFCQPTVHNAVSIAPSYGVYSVAAEINDVELREVPLNADFTLDIERLLAAADADTRLIWICSPNNPTGNAFAHADVLELARRFNGMVVVDEAYVDFAPEGSLLQYVGKVPNLIVLQTFSKAWGMASLRSGMAFASPEIAAIYARVKHPYNMNGPTQREVMRHIQQNRELMLAHVAETIAERGKLEKALASMPFVRSVYPSDANFILAKVDDADALYDYLIGNGVIVRNRSRVPGCAGCLRFTVGTPAENLKLISLLSHYNS